jgi:hypothetical protein
MLGFFAVFPPGGFIAPVGAIMNASGIPSEGDTRRCPQCRGTLVFSNRYPVLSVGMALTHSRSEVGDGIRYERAWVCRNGGCDYRELVGEA